VKNFRELQVWEKAHRFTLDLYEKTKSFPSDERFGLVSQLRRASASIGSNIAEGCGRGGRVEFARFLRIALGSASEVEYQLLLAKDLGHLDGESFRALDQQIMEVRKMLVGFLRTIESPEASA